MKLQLAISFLLKEPSAGSKAGIRRQKLVQQLWRARVSRVLPHQGRQLDVSSVRSWSSSRMTTGLHCVLAAGKFAKKVPIMRGKLKFLLNLETPVREAEDINKQRNQVYV